MYVNACGGQRFISGVFLHCSPQTFLKQCVLLNLEVTDSTRLMVTEPLGSICPCRPSAKISSVYHVALQSYQGSNLSPHAYSAGILPNNPFSEL